MSKIFVVLILLISFVYAESIVALLKKVENNAALHMSYKQQPFLCQPYGIETVQELLTRTDVNSSCKTYLQEFRLSYPKEKVFAVSTLHIQQQYSVVAIEGKCLLNLSSGYSYSEVLIEKGYARLLPSYTFNDDLIDYRFKRAVKRAKIEKAGIWSDINVRNCFLLPPKK